MAQDADLLLWTQTQGLADTGGTQEDRRHMLSTLRAKGIPTVAFHLDRWWGLDREKRVYEEPFFRCDYVFTADGGHDDEWASLDINHFWLPPAVYHAEAVDGSPQSRYRSDVAFVGSWRSYGHKEWEPKRLKMLGALRRRYGRQFKCWPVKEAIRGTELNDLYATVKVLVGDSCLAGNPSRYWSDRIPETTGRGGLLVHPQVEGLSDVHPHLPTGSDTEAMIMMIDVFLADDEARESARKKNAEHTRQNHTYKIRMQTVLDTIFPA